MKPLNEMSDEELNVAVAEKVFGLKVEMRYCMVGPCDDIHESQEQFSKLPEWEEMNTAHFLFPCYYDVDYFGPGIGDWRPVPRYSTDISDAMKVVDKLLSMTEGRDIHMEHRTDTGWRVSCHHKMGNWKDWIYDKTLPRAICLAALST